MLGIGINVNMQKADEVDQQWTSIRLESGKCIDRNVLVGELNARLNAYIQRHQLEGFSTLRAEWEANHLWQDRSVSLIAGSSHIDGVVVGIDNQGALRLKVDGVEKVFSGGELSLRLRDDS
ncbi:Biotin operon repressor / Biotin-protein ligase (EC 6.3.4.15) [Pseudomonas fluorescens]|nr:Biotin operon repressor / Biotin-protein ligase (EC 6.3.4.15) [Pseudomonas fluorescens]